MALGLGLSFGKKSQSSSGTSAIDKTTDLTGTQQTAQTSQGQTTTATTGTTSSTGTTKGATSQTQDQSTIGKQTGRTTGTTTTLGQDVQDALADRVKSILAGGISDENIQNLSNAVSGRADFDVDSFVSGITGAARNRGEQTLQEQNSAFAARAGGTASTNSMAALLAQRGRNDLEASLGGIEADARIKGESLVNENIKTSVTAQSGLAGIAEALAGTLKGGTTEVDMTQLTDEIQQLIGKTGGISTQETAETGTQQQSSQTNQLLSEIANILTNQTQREVGTETQTMKGKSGGFGLSLGL